MLVEPVDEAVARTPEGIPYLKLELVLLFKGLQTRPKDRADFDTIAPLLDTPWIRLLKTPVDSW